VSPVRASQRAIAIRGAGLIYRFALAKTWVDALRLFRRRSADGMSERLPVFV
jgi:hypothetical protein